MQVGSVIIPCYNVERWLNRALDSVLVALPNDFEVIVVDDGSTDSTPAIIKTYASKDKRLKVISLKHSGVSHARNCALDVAQGEYIFFVDPDDWVEKDFFALMLAKVRDDQADICVCAYDDTEDGEELSYLRSLKADYRFTDNSSIIDGYFPRIFGYSFKNIQSWYLGQELFATREMAAVWRMVYRRGIIEKNHIRFDEKLSLYEDAMFNAEYLLFAHSMTAINRALYHVTCRNSGAMRSVPKSSTCYVENKLRLLAKRDELNAFKNGTLTKYYEGTCVLSALEILMLTLKGRAKWSDLNNCLRIDSVHHALKNFPRTWRKPLVALASLFLLYYAQGIK